eukprot:4457-Heterococcus_DN1.PRE.1
MVSETLAAIAGEFAPPTITAAAESMAASVLICLLKPLFCADMLIGARLGLCCELGAAAASGRAKLLPFCELVGAVQALCCRIEFTTEKASVLPTRAAISRAFMVLCRVSAVMT